MRIIVKVSIIIAVYNAEKYLSQCLESLLTQNMKEIEVIAVNDGSTDKSQEILDRYKLEYKKLKCYYKENGGAAEARNYGLKYAEGEYIGFIDSDDFIDPDMYETLYYKAIENACDIVECNLRHTYEDYEDIEVMEKIYDKKELLMYGRYVVWNKIYKRIWLKETKVEFPVKLIYEDVEFIAKLVPFIGKYDYVDIAPIHYIQRKTSVNNSTSRKTLDIIVILKNILAFYKTNEFYDEYKDALEYFYARILLCSSFSRMCHMPDRAERKNALRENWDTLITAFPSWKKNRYLKKQKSYQALFMKLNNNITYRIYSGIFPVIYRLKALFDYKWKH